MITHALSFVAVVKAGSFSKASLNIGVSKAQLSRHVSQLEKTLGIQLLFRTTRSISLTEQGKQFYDSCLEIEENYENAIHEIKQDFSDVSGTLRITAPISFGQDFFPLIISEFTTLYPNVKVTLSLSSVKEDLIKEHFDIAMRVATALPDSSLRMLSLIEYDSVIVASPSYLAKKSAPKEPKDLQDHRCITAVNRTAGLINAQWQFLIKNKILNFTPNSVLEIDSLQVQIKLIKMGAGIGRIPKYFIEAELAAGELIEVMPKFKQPKFTVYLLYPNRKILPKKIQVFMEFIKAAVAERKKYNK